MNKIDPMLVACIGVGAALGLSSAAIALVLMRFFGVEPVPAMIIGCGTCLLASLAMAGGMSREDDPY